MNILQVQGTLAPKYGGPAKAGFELSRVLARQGHRVTIYTTNFDPDGILKVPTKQPVIVDGVTIHYFPVTSRAWVFSVNLGLALHNYIRNFDIVIIHGVYWFPIAMAAYLCHWYNIPYIIRPHGSLDPFLRRKGRFKKAIYHWLIAHHNLNHAAAIHYTTQEEMVLAHEAMNIQAPGVIVPLGLEIEEYTKQIPLGTLRARFPELENKHIVLFFSRINFKKGLDLLARAYGTVARQRNDVHLLIVGPDNNEGYDKHVQHWLAEEGVLDRVTFTGMLTGDDKLAVLQQSDLFVLPSYTENFGVSVVEAMACGLPVLISNKVNIWREVLQAQAGVVINCDANELAHAMLRLLDAPRGRKIMGMNGKRLVQEKFTWDSAAQQMVAVYQEILHRSIHG